MNILFCGLSLATIAFLAHFFTWRIGPPKNHSKRLLEIFFLTWLIGVLLLLKYRASVIIFGMSFPGAVCEYMQLSIFYFSITLAYIATYPAIEADSPSLAIINAVGNAGPDGLSAGLFENTMSNDVLVVPRIDDLVASGMVHREGGVFRLKPKGALLARIFIMYRKFIKITRKGG